MSRKHRREQRDIVVKSSEPQAMPIEIAGDHAGTGCGDVVAQTADPDVPEYERCPLCWGGMRGKAQPNGRYKTKARIYLKCDMCGHSWSVDCEWELKIKRINWRIPEGLSERGE